jgi:hypothetical protein
MVKNFHNPLADLNRLMAAAVIDREFCTLLLSNPIRAIGQGYYGENFHLSTETQAQLSEIRASSLPEFARQVANGKKLNGAHHGVQYDTSV